MFTPVSRDNKGRFKKGNKMPEEYKKKISKSLKKQWENGERVVKFGKESPDWKGDNVGYRGLHLWITKQFGVPSKCELCGDTSSDNRYEWANKGNYTRNKEDWEQLCVACHRLKDGWVEKVAKLNKGRIKNVYTK